ncbi:MAG: HIT domain-containing protein [Desulfurococcales archaeon]|nr:HIT domain-containing protein [Desulfurococcales archaeon]
MDKEQEKHVGLGYDILWAPWRMKYIESHGKRRGCVFCEAPLAEDPKQALVLYKGKKAYIILNKYPYNTAHTMVVPYRHVSSILLLDKDELFEMSLMVKAVVKAITEVYKPHGFNIGINMGESAGAGIAEHIHIHVVPRWCGDTNYTLIIGGVKVLPETLDQTYEKLKPAVEKACKEICGENE